MVMNDRDKGIYNSLGSSSSTSGKVHMEALAIEFNRANYHAALFLSAELRLTRGWKKRGIMWKTG